MLLPWMKSKGENENELCCNKERQLSSKKKTKKKKKRRMIEWMSFLIKGDLTHRRKQKYVRGVGPNPSLIKVCPDYLAGTPQGCILGINKPLVFHKVSFSAIWKMSGLFTQMSWTFHIKLLLNTNIFWIFAFTSPFKAPLWTSWFQQPS